MNRAGATASDSLAQKAYRDIKEQIVTSRLKPGDMLLATALSETLGMSRTPVHEALKLLCAEGLLQVIPRVGYVISSITVSDVQEIFQLRFTLEALAAELAAGRFSAEDMAAFEKTDQRFRNLAESTSRKDRSFLRKAAEANREFHVMIAAASGNRRLAEMIRGLLDESDRIILMDPRQREEIEFMSSHQHRKIVRALKNRDPEEARMAMLGHLRAARGRVMASLFPEPHVHESLEQATAG